MQSELTRRYFLQVLAVGAASTAGAIAGCSGNNSTGPEAFGDVTAGNVSALQIGSVISVPGAPAFLGRDSGGLYAMTSICTHAGCDMAGGGPTTTTINCHCHGSQFSLTGNVLQGPAQNPLTHFAVTVGADGTITVHGGNKVDPTARTPVA
jgi:Rieske Fe-S protein